MATARQSSARVARADERAPRAAPRAYASAASRRRPLEVENLGRVGYEEALTLQKELVRRRRDGEIADRLLLLEHPHVITLGTSARADHILLDEAQRRLLGIGMFETGRGGDVTYHGPGQLVGYPVIDLKPDRCDLHRYVRDLEDVLILSLADVGIGAGREPELTGVWVDGEKIAAIGVRVSSGWITSHGFALNVDTDLDFFGSIVPCGIPDHGVTSIRRLAGREVTMEEVRARVAVRFGQVFERQLAGPDKPVHHRDTVPAETSRRSSRPGGIPGCGQDPL